MKKILQDVKKILLKKDEILMVKLPSDITEEKFTEARDYLVHLFGEQVMTYCGNVQFKKVKKLKEGEALIVSGDLCENELPVILKRLVNLFGKDVVVYGKPLNIERCNKV